MKAIRKRKSVLQNFDKVLMNKANIAQYFDYSSLKEALDFIVGTELLCYTCIFILIDNLESRRAITMTYPVGYYMTDSNNLLMGQQELLSETLDKLDKFTDKFIDKYECMDLLSDVDQRENSKYHAFRQEINKVIGMTKSFNNLLEHIEKGNFNANNQSIHVSMMYRSCRG